MLYMQFKNVIDEVISYCICIKNIYYLTIRKVKEFCKLRRSVVETEYNILRIN